MREIHFEETSWKARPDWARDGRRVVYSSYLGRQRNQLWLMTAEGGDVLPLTYGEFDATSPRWSPDGDAHRVHLERERQHVARGRSTCRVGDRQPVAIRERRRLGAVGTLTSSARRLALPHLGDRARRPRLRAGRRARARRRQLRPRGAEVRVQLLPQPGRGDAQRARGHAHRRGHEGAGVPPRAQDRGRRSRRDGGTSTCALERIADLPARGWWSGDMHVHMNYGGHYRAGARRTCARQTEGRRPPRRGEPHRQQGAAHPRHRALHGRARSRFDRGHADLPQPGVPHELLGPHRPPRPHAERPPARIRRLREHRRREPPSHERRRRRPGARPGRASAATCIRSTRAPDFAATAPPAPNAVPGFHPGDPVELPDRRGPRQGRLLRGRGLQRPPGHERGLVPAAQRGVPDPRRARAPTPWPTTRRCAARWA